MSDNISSELTWPETRDIFVQELEARPHRLRRCYLWGYLNVFASAPLYGALFLKDPHKDLQELSEFIKGVQQSVHDGVAKRSGLVNGVSLILDPLVKYGPHRSALCQAFIDGVGSGYDSLMDNNADELSAYAFVRTISEQWARTGSYSPMPADMHWPFPPAAHYKKARDIALQLPSPEKESLISDLSRFTPLFPRQPAYEALFKTPAATPRPLSP